MSAASRPDVLLVGGKEKKRRLTILNDISDDKENNKGGPNFQLNVESAKEIMTLVFKITADSITC